MGTDWTDIAYEQYLEARYEEELVEDALRGISEESVKGYLGKYGDAVEERVRFCLNQAGRLKHGGYWGASLVLSATAIELIIRFMLLRPLVQGAFLSDEWADILSKRIATGRAAEDRDLLPAVLRKWNVDVTHRSIADGKSLWKTMRSVVWKKRNGFVHQASPVSEQEASMALECANAFMEIVLEMADRLGFTLSLTGKWCEIDTRREGTSSSLYTCASFDPESPFSE
jgi:hypothetical protein